MNQHLFITARERLNPRWQEAFDTAGYCKLSNFEATPAKAGELICWLDISLLTVEERLLAIKQIASKVEKLVVMSDELSETEAFKVMQFGAAGYCHYLAAPEQLVEIAAVVSRGGLWIGAQLMQKLLTVTAGAHQSESQAALVAEEVLSNLTPRERMVAIEVGKGATNKEIATRLEITERTVKAHISVIFEKLGVRDRVQLALFINNLSKNPQSLSFSTIA